jgi:hypothetical protein
MPKKFVVNPKYTHFAVRKSDNLIVNGWDYNDTDPNEVKMWAKADLQDQFPDCKNVLDEYKVLTSKHLIRNGLDPFNLDNWAKGI